MDYCQFFATENEAMAHCRQKNHGLTSIDPRCCAVVDGPGDENGAPNYAVVDLHTARDLLDDGDNRLTCLIVTF